MKKLQNIFVAIASLILHVVLLIAVAGMRRKRTQEEYVPDWHPGQMFP